MSAPDGAEVTELLARWWLRYDAGDIDGLGPLLTEDAGFRCRTDTGQTDWEEFVRLDVTGRDAILHWQGKHRAASPDPLRHMALNVVADPGDGDTATFTSYLLVTQVKGGKPDPLPGGVLRGAVARTGEGLRFTDLELVLDTQDSIPREERTG